MDITIIGAGVIGLAIARELASTNHRLTILEKENRPGTGISSRNSEVIHAGIYYPYDSLKAKLCVSGARLLYEYCTAHSVPFIKIGKVIVATGPKEEHALDDLFFHGINNHVPCLKLMNKHELQKIEPNVSGCRALYSPNTGIIDSHRLIKILEADSLDHGVTILYRHELVGIHKSDSGFACTARGPDSALHAFSSRIIINAAGLHADSVASLAGMDIDNAGYRIYPVKGEYFRVKSSKSSLVKGLVYPVPDAHLSSGLGIHATKDLAGSLRLGPNAIPATELTYDVEPSHAGIFYRNACHMFPFLEPDDLTPDMAGIRPRIQKPGETQKDFIISHEKALGFTGLINLIGIESPGLTSCFSIAAYVSAMMKNDGLLD